MKTYKFQDYEAIWLHSQASGNDLLLLLALVKFRQPNGMYATKGTLAEIMRCNVDTVDRCLTRLKELGELSWVRGSDRAKRANRYLILLPGLDGDTPANSPRVSTANSPLVSRVIPPYSQGEYPRNITPLNSNETERNSNSVFETFFALYPKQQARSKALHQFMLIPQEQYDVILAATQTYRDSVRGVEPKFVPFAHNWLLQERWTDKVVVDVVDDWKRRAVT